MAKPKVISVANQRGGIGKSTTVYNLGAGLVMDGKRVLLVDVDPQGDLIKMLVQRKPHDLPLTLASVMNDVVSRMMPHDHPEIMHHHEGGTGERHEPETMLGQYVDSVKQDYDLLNNFTPIAFGGN